MFIFIIVNRREIRSHHPVQRRKGAIQHLDDRKQPLGLSSRSSSLRTQNPPPTTKCLVTNVVEGGGKTNHANTQFLEFVSEIPVVTAHTRHTITKPPTRGETAARVSLG